MKAPYHAKHDRGTPSNLNSVYYPSTSIQEGGVESDDNTFDFSIKLRKRLKPKAKRLSPMRINIKAISFKMMKKGMSEALKPIQKQKPEDSSKKHQRSASVRTAKVDNRLAYSLKSESKYGPTVENYMRKIALKSFEISHIKTRLNQFSGQIKKQNASSINPRRKICSNITPGLTNGRLSSCQKHLNSYTKTAGSSQSFKTSFDTQNYVNSDYADFRASTANNGNKRKDNSSSTHN